MICYTTEDEAQKAIEGIKNKEGWTAKRYKIKWDIKVQENKKYNKGNRINSRATENLERQCYVCNSKDHEIRNIFVTNKERTSANQLRYIMEENGNVTRIKIRSGNGYQVKAAMVCYSEKEKAEIAIKEINKYTGWRAEEYRNINRQIEDQEKYTKEKQTTNNNEIEEKIEKEINKVKEKLIEIQTALRAITNKQQRLEKAKIEKEIKNRGNNTQKELQSRNTQENRTSEQKLTVQENEIKETIRHKIKIQQGKKLEDPRK